MTLAEKHYRSTFKIKEGIKLTNDQWKIVNMMHRCLQEYNKPKLPHGTMLIQRSELKGYLACIENALKETDLLMQKPENRDVARSPLGSAIGRIWSKANFVKDSIKHFSLDVPLERLNEEVTDGLPY